jgi:hypothetical protein
MGHHLTDDGQFKSDRYPDLPAGKIVLSFKDRHAQLGLWVTAIDYRAYDPGLSADIMEALTRIGWVPPRAMFEDAWAWSIACEHGINPRDTVRAFVHAQEEGGAYRGCPLIHLVGSQKAVDEFRSSVASSPEFQDHYLTAETETPPRSTTDDGRPDFHGFLLALRAEYYRSTSLHSENKTGHAASDQRVLDGLARYVELAGQRLGFLPVPKATDPILSPAELVKWLREVAMDATDERRWSLEGANPAARADNASRLFAAAKLLWEEPIGGWLSAAHIRVAHNMRLPADVTDAVAVAQLRAAADAIEKLYPPAPAELVKWLREVATAVADDRPWFSCSGASAAARLWGAATLLWEDPVGKQLRALYVQVENNRWLCSPSTKDAVATQLRAAADAIEKLYPVKG